MSSTTSSGRRTRSARPGSRPGWLLASLAASSAFVLAGCGGQRAPALDRADAHRLIVLADRAATVQGECAQQRAIAQVQTEATRLVNARRVPPELQESLLSAVNALVADQPTCLPDVPAASTTTAGQPSPPGRVHVPHARPPGFPHHHHPGHDHGPGPGHGHHGHDR